jgi:hypothetical protein
MEGLEFLRPMADQQKQIIAQNKELANLIKQHLSRPLPAPEIKVDYNELALELKKLIGDPVGNISKANEEFKSTVNQFGRMASDVPKSVSIRGEFYGFTGWKPFVLHYLIIIFSVGFGAYSWIRNSDDETVRRLTKNRDVLDGRIESLKDKNPVTASIYFPEYLTLADKAKLKWNKLTK